MLRLSLGLTLVSLSGRLPFDLSSLVRVTEDTDTEETDTPPVDGDGDGYIDNDCGDADANVHPSAEELCNGIDDDCDDAVDEEATDAVTFYADLDGDGYGVSTDIVEACETPEGYADQVGDCDDADATVSPGLEETCGDFVDNDCDELVDENEDLDGDGWTTCDGDCADEIGSINPDASEVCDDVDNDCDGEIDLDATDASVFYLDLDGDLYGDAEVVLNACDAPEGYVADATDCDDADPAVNPSEEEICDGVDNDCDDEIDVDATDATTWYADLDRDRFGDDDVSVLACDAPTDYTDVGGDCDDADASVNPDAAEVCDGVDQDCDGTIADEGVDDDGDGQTACGGDCDDTDGAINTAAPEDCNGADDNCDGVIDEDLPAATFAYDEDLDGYGDADITVNACAAPSGYVADASDCDDADSTIDPAALEVCDGVDDENCDGEVDESTASDASVWYLDADADSFGGSTVSVDACDEPLGYVANADDCDDADAGTYPAATELCDGIDNDCDLSVPTDEVDADADDYAECAGDCDDADASVHPDADEDLDGLDNDCDGDIDDGTDAFDDDGDCYCESGVCTGSVTSSCASVASGDCDDDASGISPGEAESCDNDDNNCDGEVDEGVTPTWYYDNDGDFYGDNASTNSSCSSPSGSYVAVGDDCDDTDEDVHPGMTEDVASAFACYDHVDNDCDGDDPTATGQEWDFGDSDCTVYSVTGDIAIGDNLLSNETFGGGSTSDWVDVPTDYASDDTLTIGVSCSGGPTDVGRGCYMEITQPYPSGDPAREALCASLTGFTAGNYYQLVYLAVSDSGSSFTIDRSLLTTSFADFSSIDVEPTDPAYGDWDFVTTTASWAGYEEIFLAADDEMTFCYGIDGGNLSFARISLRDVGP